jgi:hypothetical protein
VYPAFDRLRRRQLTITPPAREARMSRTETLMTLTDSQDERIEHPVDTIERIAAVNEWSFERDEDDEISIAVKGSWSDYHVAFTWLDTMEALHMACAFDLKIPERRKTELMKFVAAINEQLWVGHFDLWSREDVVMFRHALVLSGGLEPNARQCEQMLKLATEACERHYQGFQFVVWAGKTAEEALQATMFETVGQA